MPKKLVIELFDVNNNSRKKITCGHLDSTRRITILSECEPGLTNPGNSYTDIIIPEKIDHFNFLEGLITIYYQSGHYLEVRQTID